MNDNKFPNDRVFLIISNQSKLDNMINYSLSKANGMKNFQSILKKTSKYKREDFTTYVFYFDIFPEELNKKEKETNSQKYKAKVILKYKKMNFEGQILFKENKNNFVYDFKFGDYKGWTGYTSPPVAINYSKVEQIKIFNEVLKILKVKQEDKLYKNLITDSQCYITGHKYYLDFYLEILKSCYSQNEVKTLLMMFKLVNVLLPEKMEIKNYSNALNFIEKKPDIIIRHCTNKDKKERYFKFFYTILLYFRMNYDPAKIETLLQSEKANQYLIEILPINYKYFSNLVIPDKIIVDVLKQQQLNYNTIFGILSYVKTTEQTLSIINNNREKIANCCLKENQKIIMSELANPKQTDDLNKIIKEIENILDYQMKSKKIFISFDEQFWKNYIQYNDKTNLKNLVLINKALLLCKKADTYFNPEKLGLKMKIHNTGLSEIEKGALKNEDLLKFIENEDIYFTEKYYESKGFRPLTVLKGIDLEKANDEFYEKWNKSKIFIIYSFIDIEFKKELVNKIDDMKDFGKLLKLFDYNDKKKFDMNTGSLIREKFKSLIKTYKI